MATTYRRRTNFIGGVLTAQANGASAVAGTAVALTSDGFAALGTLGTDEYFPIVIDPDGIDGAPHTMYLTVHTSGSTAATGLTGQEGTTPRAHDIDTPWVHSGTTRDYPTLRFVRRTSADITLNSTSWANVDTGMDLVLAAQVGDIIRATLSGLWGSAAVDVKLDVVTVVSGSPVNSFYKAGAAPSGAGGSDLGIPSWAAISGTNNPPVGSPSFYTVVSGDLASGLVTFRLRYFTGAATNRILFANSTGPLTFAVENLGSQGY